MISTVVLRIEILRSGTGMIPVPISPILIISIERLYQRGTRDLGEYGTHNILNISQPAPRPPREEHDTHERPPRIHGADSLRHMIIVPFHSLSPP